MKIDVQGIEEIKSTIETPFQTLAQQMSDKGVMDKELSEIVTFIFEKINSLGEEPWEIVG